MRNKLETTFNTVRVPGQRMPAILIGMALLAGCGDRSAGLPDNYDELAPYYEDEVIADFPDEMAEFRAAFDKSALPFATAEGKVGKTSVYDSKLLGVPYMPKGFEYPRDPDGRPLKLLAQINFADVPPLPDYPDTGILQFYISDDIDSRKQAWGLQFYSKKLYDADKRFELMQSQEYFRVVWHTSVTENENELTREVPAGREGFLPVVDEAKLTFTAGTSYPGPADYRFNKVFGGNGWEFFDRFGDQAESVAVRYSSHVTVRSIAWVGGYADFTQWDPREHAPDEDWLLLFELASSSSLDQPEVMWGDAGIGAFFIRPEDLRRRNFSRVLYTWDNH